MYGSTGASQSVKRSLEDSAALARESESIGIDALHEMMRQRELLEQASENVCFRVSNTSFRQYMLLLRCFSCYTIFYRAFPI